MRNLMSEIQKNLTFFLVCIAIVVALALLARLAERFMPEKRKVTTARRLTIIGICAAIATVLHVLDFPLLFLAPEFYKLDFSELPVLLCGFFLGPSATVACEGIKILLKLVLKSTSTAFVGDFANFVVGCSLVLPATIIYHTHKSRHSALLPKFAQLYGMPLDTIIAMGTKINGNIHNVSTFVLICVAPLNLIKSAAVSVLTLLLYKRVARPLFGLRQ